MYKRKGTSQTGGATKKGGTRRPQYGPLMKSGAFYSRPRASRSRFRSSDELKFFDTALSFSVDATGEVPVTGQLNLIPQGVTESQRVGRKCVIKSIQIKAIMATTYGASTTPNGVTNIWLVLDKQCNGAAAAVTDVFTSTTLNGALRNLSNSSRFLILKKWTHQWSPVSGVSAAFADLAQPLEYYKKCNIPIEFSSTTGAITEIKSNNLFLVSGANANIDDIVSVNGNCRVKFSDN